MSSTESRIFDLIDKWEDARLEGHAPTPEELCTECPELIPDVARRIKALNATAWMEKPVAPVSVETCPQQKTVGRYELIELIGKGGFADVWKAHDPELNRFVAIKIPRNSSPTFHSENFLEEGRKAAKLRHPGIVSVLDVGRMNDQWFIVSELFEGGSLAERIKTKPPSHHESIRLVSQIAEALFHAHQQGFIHRDIKPQNILMDEYGNPKITDFGIALSETQTVAERSRSAGTLAYMSPEQASNRTDEIDARTDIYSLGVVFYQLLTGRLPFVPKDSLELWGDIISHAPRTPRTIDRSIPIEVERVCLKAMAKNPSDRYSTAHDFADELKQLMVQPKKPLRKTARAIVLAGVILASGGLVWWSSVNQKQEKTFSEEEKGIYEFVKEFKKKTKVAAERGNSKDDIVKEVNKQTEIATKLMMSRVSKAKKSVDQIQEQMRNLPALAELNNSQREASAELAVRMGAKALAEGDQSTALAEFNRAIELHDRYADGWHGRGAVFFNQGKYADAVTDFRKAVELESRKPEYFKNLAYALSKAENHDEAVKAILIGQSKTTLEERAEYKRFVSQIYDSRAAQRTKNGYQEGAIADLNEAIKWDDTNPAAFDNRGAIRYNSKQYEQAIEDFTTAISLAPNRPEFFVHRGHALTGLGRNSEGQSDYEAARRLEKAAGK